MKHTPNRKIKINNQNTKFQTKQNEIKSTKILFILFCVDQLPLGMEHAMKCGWYVQIDFIGETNFFFVRAF